MANVKHLLIALLLISAGTAALAQPSDTPMQLHDKIAKKTAGDNNKVRVYLGADVLSKYIWRGFDLGDVSMQPELAVEWRGLKLAVTNNTPISDTVNDSREIDIRLDWSIGNLTLGLYDQWADDVDPRYFNYKLPHTGHTVEAALMYDFGFFDVMWATNIAGWDHDWNEDMGVDGYGKRQWSSYLEFNVPFTFQQLDWTATVGIAPYKSFYYEVRNFSIINAGIRAAKDIPISSNFSIPVFGEIVTSPSQGNFYLVVGANISIFK